MTTEYDLKKSSPTLAKAGRNGSIRGLGSGANICGAGLARCILHSLAKGSQGLFSLCYGSLSSFFTDTAIRVTNTAACNSKTWDG
ncbi:hypothetical protein DAPPUDRAFT_306305 [Daphnia pulex]|uniref:Uncharacterized protein n=1 Tax=Daphnia pulex TaxID=6669 RepID=E9GWM3_DAPPU|nr:hypothetical protein DAPPUDRAFT_306305 [Daphnia pulex]|eukprot:EFX76158.1 hypothetical protein DAPPUDRAFT_306305 [Daphnia pulex]